MWLAPHSDLQASFIGYSINNIPPHSPHPSQRESHTTEPTCPVNVYLLKFLVLFRIPTVSLFCWDRFSCVPGLPPNCLCSQGCPWTPESSVFTSRLLDSRCVLPHLSICTLGDWAQGFLLATGVLYPLTTFQPFMVSFADENEIKHVLIYLVKE